MRHYYKSKPSISIAAVMLRLKIFNVLLFNKPICGRGRLPCLSWLMIKIVNPPTGSLYLSVTLIELQSAATGAGIITLDCGYLISYNAPSSRAIATRRPLFMKQHHCCVIMRFSSASSSLMSSPDTSITTCLISPLKWNGAS